METCSFFKYPGVSQRQITSSGWSVCRDRRFASERGDLFLVNDDKTTSIRRFESPDKQNAIQLLVHDDAYRSSLLDDVGWPQRWSGRVRDQEGWQPVDEQWQLTPGRTLLRILKKAERRPGFVIGISPPRSVTGTTSTLDVLSTRREHLISDFCGYNAVWGDGTDIDYRRPVDIETGAFGSEI